MKNLCLIFFWFGFVITVNANPPACDSLPDYSAIDQQIWSKQGSFYKIDYNVGVDLFNQLIEIGKREKCWDYYVNDHILKIKWTLHQNKLVYAYKFLEQADQVIEQYKDSLSYNEDFSYYEYFKVQNQNNRIRYYYEAGLNNKAESLIKNLNLTLENIGEKKFYEKDALIDNYQYLGGIYNRQWRFEEAIDNYRRSINIAKSIGQGKYYNGIKLLANAQLNSANVVGTQHKANKLKEAEKNYLIALKGSKIVIETNKDSNNAIDLEKYERVISILIQLAKLNSIQNKFEKADTYLQEALIIEEKDLSQKALVLDELGHLALRKGQCIRAERLYLEAKKYKKENLDVNHFEMANSSIYLAKAKLECRDFNGAIQLLNETQKLYFPESGKRLNNPLILITLKNLLGDTYKKLYEEAANINYLKEALAHYEEAINLIKEQQQNYDYDNDKETLVQNYSGLFENMIIVAHQLGEEFWEKAFYCSEKEKSIKILESLKHTNALELAGIPEDMIIREAELVRQIADKRIKLDKNNNDERLEEEIINLRQLLKEHIKKYKAINEDFYKERYEQKEVTIKEIQNSLIGAKTALIEYFVTSQDAIFIWLITKNGFKMYKVSKTREWANIDVLLKLMNDSLGTRENPENKNKIVRISQFLHQTLIAPLNLSATIDKLIIVPDGKIKLIPFDYLSKEIVPVDNYHDRMISQYAISYGGSANLLYQQQRKNTIKSDLLYHAFTAIDNPCDSGKGEVNLKNILQSFKKVVQEWQGVLFEKTTSSIFEENAPNSDILGMGLHTKLNNANPYFSKFILNPEQAGDCGSNELSFIKVHSMNLKAKTVILVNCEAGKDNSLAEKALAFSFNFAGVNSFFAPLWEIPDKQSGSINSYLNNFLKEGKGKPEALRLAKLKYLESTQDDIIALHPYFWASFVHYGNDNPIIISFWERWKPTILGFGGIVFLMIFLIKSRKNN